jgi:phage I-like protein
MFMQTYEVDPNSGEVQLTGQPQLVRREVSFVPITQQEHPMTTNCKCTEKVQKILSAANSPFAKTDEEWLSTLTEEQLDKLMAPATVVNVQTPEPTLAALLEKADPALRESIERGMQLHQQERANLEQSVLANTTQFTAEELSKMEGSFLRRLASAVARPVRMAAGGMAVHSPAAEEEEGLDSPWIEKKA